MANAIHIDIDVYLDDCPPWDESLPSDLRAEVAAEVARRFDSTSIYDQIGDLACQFLRERGFGPEQITPTAEVLKLRHGAWGEHPGHPRSDWQQEVANRETCLGYFDWLVEKLDLDAEENSDG